MIIRTRPNLVLTNMAWSRIRSLAGNNDTIVVSKWYRSGSDRVGVSDNFA